STADYLRLADGSRFSARLSDTSTFSCALPEAFGFLGPTPASITTDHSTLQVQAGKTLSLIGGNIQISGGGNHSPALVAPSGRIMVVSVASPGEVISNGAGQTSPPDISAFSRLGSIQMSGSAVLSTDGDGGGTITIRGGSLMMVPAGLSANTQGA